LKFIYPNLKTHDICGQRWYDTPAGYLPSITTVLGDTCPADKVQSLLNWKESLGHEKADEVSKTAADNGTVFHSLIERYLKHQDLLAPFKGYVIEEHNLAALNGIKMKLNNINEVWCLETSLYSAELYVAGRVDCAGVYKHVPSIIDFKTSRRLKKDHEIEDYKLQLTAYSIMHNEMFNTRICQGVILMSVDGGFPIEFKVNLPDYYDQLNERVETFFEQTKTKLFIEAI